MYKRKAHVVFLDSTGPAAALAAALARQRGADWLEARAAALVPSQPPAGLAARLEALGHAGLGIEPLRGELLRWADLVVHFDADIAARLDRVPPTTRLKHWPLDVDATLPDDRLTAALTARVDGMIGGMRMLARLSSEEDD